MKKLHFMFKTGLTLSWRRPLSYRNQSIDLLCKLMDWFLYDNGLRHERVDIFNFSIIDNPSSELGLNAFFEIAVRGCQLFKNFIKLFAWKDLPFLLRCNFLLLRQVASILSLSIRCKPFDVGTCYIKKEKNFWKNVFKNCRHSIFSQYLSY